MRMRWILFTIVLLCATRAANAQPTQVSYQGQLYSSGSPFTGTAQMRFVLLSGGTVLWSHDGTSATGEMPDTAVPVTVDQGIFSVFLGGSGMQPLTANLLFNASTATLRIWVDTGGGIEQLSDQALGSSAFALHAESSERSFGTFVANGLIQSTSGGFKFPDGTIQTTASTGVGASTLDQAYDGGGSGAGRTITADAGAVSVQGTDGLRVNGSIGVGLTAAPYARISVANVGGNDTTKLLAFDEGEGGEFHFESGFAGTGSTGNFLKMNTAWTTNAMVWRGDGNVGLGTTSPGGRLTILHAGGSISSPALAAYDISTTGTSIVASSFGSGPTVALSNGSTGDILQFGDAIGSPEGRIDNGGRLRMQAPFGSGVAGAAIYSENTTTNGIAYWGKVTSSDATQVLEQNGTGSLIRAFKSGSLKFEVTNTGRVVTTALQITGGGDLAEPFTISNGAQVESGTVLVIDERHEGQLCVSHHAYDTKVAGVVSGARGLEAGITLTPSAHQVGGQNVALSGRVYVLADASNGPIHVGDLLTTSSTPGHAMKAEAVRAAGAVLGKAMSSLETGRGMVLALVSLQ